MADFREKPIDADAPKTANPQQAGIERLLMSYGEQTFQEFSRYRFAEEREWYEQALFYQRRQWLRWNDSSRRFDQIKQDSDRPKPMPVSNYFKKAINDNANQLQAPRMTATATDDSDANRRGAEFAQRAIEAIDRESGMNILRPKLAKHVPLWGIGCTKDVIDTSTSTGTDQVGQFGVKNYKMVSCLDCGKVSPVTPAAATPARQTPGVDTDPNQPVKSMGESGELVEPSEADTTCPQCQSTKTTPFDKSELGVESIMEFAKGKLCTEVPPIFEIYLPRDCRDANLAPRICQRYRKPLGKIRQMYGDRAANIKAEAPYDVHQIYMEALRALVNYNYMHEQTIESTTITEIWADWSELPKKLQDRLENFWKTEDPDKIERAHLCGIYLIYAGGTMLDWGVNPWWDETEQLAYKPYTFYLWELDPANVYNTGIGTDLVPLQKRLNRLDSLNELAWMTNGVGKWLWPTAQSGKAPSGSPNEVIPYETVGEGKVKPEFVPGNPINPAVFNLRQSILGDFQALGNILGAAAGVPPPGVKSFRGQAYAGQKAEEQTNTQRYLWEKGNELRYRKTLLMAQKCWDSPRKARVAGYNGKFGMMALDGNMLQGQYTLQFVADSSKPQLPSEKQAAFGMMAQGGLIDLTDSAVREYAADVLNMNDVNMTDHLQYLKAERDLEKIKQGQVPQENGFVKYDIFLKVFANFTLTEEFEGLNPMIQQGILLYTEHLSQMTTMATGGLPGTNPQAMAAQLGGAMAGGGGKKKPGSPLNKVPGQDISAAGAQHAAVGEAQQVRAAIQ